MMISIENVGKVTIEVKFPCAACSEAMSNNPNLCQLYRCLVHKRCSGIRGKLKQDS